MNLPDQNEVAETGLTLPLPLPADGADPFPYFSCQTRLRNSKEVSVPTHRVTFDMEYFPGDPDIAPGINSSLADVRWDTR